MFLKKLTLLNFKNYSDLEVGFSSKINCLTGNNGVGKTNVLDAIYYLSFCKSFFTSVDSMNIKHNENLFTIKGEYDISNSNEDIFCGFERGKRKRFKRNKKDYDRLADHIGLIPLVMITPYDINLIIGGSDERRKFVDGIISQYDRNYLFDLQRYNKTLAQRNALLKEFNKKNNFNADILEIYDVQLVETGNRIFEKRKDFVEELKPLFQNYFEYISLRNESVSLHYESQLTDSNMEYLLQANRKKDTISTYTNGGVHKDDFVFMLGDYHIRKIGSQGQQKSYLVALKLAQFDFIRKVFGFMPILLLDDVFDKLDSLRVEQIMKLVAEDSFGQIFITDTSIERVKIILEKVAVSYNHYVVEKNNLSKIE